MSPAEFGKMTLEEFRAKWSGYKEKEVRAAWWQGVFSGMNDMEKYPSLKKALEVLEDKEGD